GAAPAPPSLSYVSAAAAIAGAMPATASKTSGAKPGANISAFTLGPGLDELGIAVGGFRSPAAALLDGPVSQDNAADAPGQDVTLPVSAGRRAERKARAARLGPPRGGDDLPEESEAPGTSPAPQPQNHGRPVHARAFDASEGTPLDPLRNKTYDLNYAKTVPPIE
ncbi:MAG: endolytic transglycosylase MltG, partial [Methylocella sp.]